MERYFFVTHWFLESPIENVWQSLTDLTSYSAWWPGVKKLTTSSPNGPMHAGMLYDWEVKSGLPYTLRFSTRIVKMRSPCYLQFRVDGELEGDCRYVLEPRADGTAVTIYWDNRTPKTIMNLGAKLPFVRGLFAANHTALMDNGYRGLKARIEDNAS